MKNIKKLKIEEISPETTPVYYDLVEHYDMYRPVVIYKNIFGELGYISEDGSIHDVEGVEWWGVLYTLKNILKYHKRIGLLINFNNRLMYKEDLRLAKIDSIVK